ncbi:MAG: glycine cleavage system protein GcvH [Methanomassiliicoccales archaeon]
MSEIREGLLYTEDHEWVKVEDGKARLGITDHAQNEMTEIVYAEVAEAGSKVNKGDTIGAVESVKTVADIYSPVSGEVVEANQDLEDAPQKVNESPYDQGWFAVIQIEDESELDGLMDPEEYEEFLEED